MPTFAVRLIEYAAYSSYVVHVRAADADEACRKARERVEGSSTPKPKFEHWDGNRPFVHSVNDDDVPVPFEHGELAVTHPAAARMLEALKMVRDDFGRDYRGPTMSAVKAAIEAVEGARHAA